MKKRMLLGCIALIMVFTLVGCSSDKSESPKESQAADVAAVESEGTDPITYTWGRNIDPNMDMITKLKELTSETLNDNRWTRLFKEKLNVSVDYKMISDSTTYNDKMKLAMASGSLPDMFQINQSSDLKQLMEAGAIEELGPLYDKYGSELLKSLIEKETKRVFEPATHDGKIYAIPQKMPSTNDYNHLWIREDWLTKVGLQRPKTMDDLYAIATAFATKDPDGNSKNDTFGLEIDNNFRYDMNGFFWAYNAFPLVYVEKDGKVAQGAIQAEMKEPLALLQKMFKDGLLDKEFGTKDNGKAMESVIAGKTGMFYGPHWMAGAADKSKANDPNAKWIVVPLPTKTGEPVKIPLTISVDGYMVVKKGTKHPENLIKMMNLYAEALFGKTAEFNKYFGENGIDNIWQMSPVYFLDPGLDLQGHQDIKKALADNTTDSLTGVAKGFYKNMTDGNAAFSMMFGPTDTPFAFVDATYPKQVIWNAYIGAPTPTMVARGNSMDELVVTTLTSIIQAKSEVNSGFDKMVEEWNSIGGTKVLEEINAALGK
ncbi:extracellular solute-binding protein [Paenibacillus psychroresistens]|uniref:Extracellular solute-binding protein n=1 Tax=Paenibacillus psychroresistens TaxID=1778678 RepID=A0A6B8REH0_9BACL|nr:extracellular solute-binding protein [Paenibacillus psychroresistens]QGQ94881.1 extracellular solute-binding protein [Paenibacillus psychroresistens]